MPTSLPALARRTAAAALLLGALVGGPAAHADTAFPPTSRSTQAGGLPLGPAGLSEQRTVRTLQPGVTVTTIVRGETDPTEFWTVEVFVPASAGTPDPDPDAPTLALGTESAANATADRLRAAGLDPRVEPVSTPAVTDYAGGLIGYRLRIGNHPDKATADATLARLRATGLNGASVYTGWDGSPASRGPWTVRAVTIDPLWFRGSLGASFGPDIEARERTSILGRDAVAAVNAGFFVLDPNSGAPGDPAGVGVYGGRLLSETTNGRPALVLNDDARGTDVRRLSWEGEVRVGSTRLPLDGLNRVPGMIRNCGGTADDLPTSRPLHDVTCKDPDELVAFTPDYAASTPAGPGTEVVVSRGGAVVEVRSHRGGALPAGGWSVQAIGTQAAALEAAAPVGSRPLLTSTLADERGAIVRPSPSTWILNGGPELVSGGRENITVAADGIVHPGDPNFYYGWAAKRHPRTLAGVDEAGRTVLVTVDGRSTASLGLTIAEAGAVARALGLREAINLDGGGSTTMVVHGQVVNSPSDAAGERPVGDAILVAPAADRQAARWQG